MHVVKGHGTENDFLVLPDLDGAVDLTPAMVRALCDRHAGVGADGILRVVRSENDPEAKDMAAEAPLFMDYRNADGSVAEMCGNGLRVFVRYLQRVCLVDDVAAVATRGGIRRVRAPRGGGNVTVYMGLPRVFADRPIVTAARICGNSTTSDRGLPTSGIALQIPNPHVVVPVANVADLEALDLSRLPTVEPPLPDGQNVEFVVRRGDRHLQLRVHERGVGETRSCGTGICAAVVAVATAEQITADGEAWRVDVPGGTCEVRWLPSGEVLLSGPAVLVADLDVDDEWLRAASEKLNPAAG